MTDPDSPLSINDYKLAQGLYSLVPAKGPVSFSSQQWRAFYIAQKLDLASSKRILIVGAGVAGVTLALALNKRAEKESARVEIVLIDAQAEPLQTTATASHRHTHPTVNFWPRHLEMYPFSSTTVFPFLNWHSDNTENVIQQLKQDEEYGLLISGGLEKLRFENLSVLSDLVPNTPEEGWYPEITKSGVKQAVFGGLPTDESNLYNCVVLCTGFGEERLTYYSQAKQYWQTDNVKNVRTAHHQYNSQIDVYGTGDGALIDFGRLASKQLNVPDPQEYNLALHFIAHFTGRSFSNIRPFGDNFRSGNEKLLFTTIEEDHASADGTKTENQVIFDKIKGVRELRRISDEFKAEYFAETNRIDKLKLFGKDVSPFESNSSVVNQLLFQAIDSIAGEPNYEQKEFDSNAGTKEPTQYLRIGPIMDVGFLPHNIDNQRNKADARFRLEESNLFDIFGYSFNAEYFEKIVRIYIERFFPDATFEIEINPEDSDNLKPSKMRVRLFLPEAESKYEKTRLELGGFDSHLYGSEIEYFKNADFETDLVFR